MDLAVLTAGFDDLKVFFFKAKYFYDSVVFYLLLFPFSV